MIVARLTAAGGAPPVTRESAREAAARELSKPIYHRDDDPWPVRLLRAVEHWLARVLHEAADRAPGGGTGALVIAVVVVTLVVVARLRLGPIRREHRVGAVLADTGPTTAAEHRARAERAAAAGQWRDAVVEGMRAIARELEERGMVDVRPGRTADELAADASAARPGSGAALRAAAAVFDAVAYGGRAATSDSYAAVVSADRAVRDRPHIASATG